MKLQGRSSGGTRKGGWLRPPALAGLLCAAVVALTGASAAAAAAADEAPAFSSGDIEVTPAGAFGDEAPMPESEGSRAKRRAAQWYETGEDAGPTVNCIHGYGESLGRAWTGWYGDIGVSPTTNNVYYVKVGWGVSGNPCGGGAYVHAEVVLPANTELAISNQNKVRCFYDGLSTPMQEYPQGCPQQPQQGIHGGYAFDPPEGTWPTATGTLYELLIPVRTTRPLNGAVPATGPCNTCLYAGVWMIDGSNSPWVWPRIPVYVGGSASTSGPYITYPGPSTTAISYDPNAGKAFATLNANLFTEGKSGQAWFEMGFSEGDYEFQSAQPASLSPNNYTLSEAWYMIPGREYHWRLCFQPSSGQRVCGADQAFTAPPDTVIGAVKVNKRKRKATVSFASPTPGLSFECKLDAKPWKACDPPQTFKKLKRGRHSIAVRARDTHGNVDGTPAREEFKV